MSMSKRMIAKLPPGVKPEAISKIDLINGMDVPADRARFADTILTALKDSCGETFDGEMLRLGMQSRPDFLRAIDAYITLREQYPGIAFHDEFVTRTGTDVSDVALFLIDSIVTKSNIKDRYDVMSEICEVLERKYGDGPALEKGLRKLNMQTTDKILHAIDLYFIMRKLYPSMNFRRERIQKAWADVV